MAKRGGVRDGTATRRALIDAAAKLFALHGVEAVSIRAINAEAGLGAASAHYHFGSRDAILDAVLVDAGSGVLGRIHDLAQREIDRGGTPSGKGLVELLATPYREFLAAEPDRGVRWLTICGQLSLSHDPRLFPVQDDTSELLRVLLRRAYPGVAAEDLDMNWLLTVNSLIVLAARWSNANLSEARGLDEGRFTALVDFVAGGLTALMEESAH